MEATTQITNGQEIDVEIEMAALCIKLAWVVRAMKANDDSPAVEILEGLSKQFDNLVGPIAEMQREVRQQ